MKVKKNEENGLVVIQELEFDTGFDREYISDFQIIDPENEIIAIASGCGNIEVVQFDFEEKKTEKIGQIKLDLIKNIDEEVQSISILEGKIIVQVIYTSLSDYGNISRIIVLGPGEYTNLNILHELDLKLENLEPIERLIYVKNSHPGNKHQFLAGISGVEMCFFVIFEVNLDNFHIRELKEKRLFVDVKEPVSFATLKENQEHSVAVIGKNMNLAIIDFKC